MVRAIACRSPPSTPSAGGSAWSAASSRGCQGCAAAGPAASTHASVAHRRRPAPPQCSPDLDRQGAGIDTLLTLAEMHRLDRTVGAGIVRHLGLHYFEDEQHVAGLDLVARLDQDLPNIARHHGFDGFGHDRNLPCLIQTMLAGEQTSLSFLRNACASSTLTDLKR